MHCMSGSGEESSSITREGGREGIFTDIAYDSSLSARRGGLFLKKQSKIEQLLVRTEGD